MKLSVPRPLFVISSTNEFTGTSSAMQARMVQSSFPKQRAINSPHECLGRCSSSCRVRGKRREKRKKKGSKLTITTPMQSFRTSHKPRPNKQTRQSEQRPRNPTYHRRPISNRGTTKSLGDSLDDCKSFPMSVSQSVIIDYTKNKKDSTTNVHN